MRQLAPEATLGQQIASVIAAALADGLFPPERADRYRRLLHADPEHTTAAIASLQPTGELVRAAQGASEMAASLPTRGPAYPPDWLPELGPARERASAEAEVQRERLIGRTFGSTPITIGED